MKGYEQLNEINSAIPFINEKFVEFEKERKKQQRDKKPEKRKQFPNKKTLKIECSKRQARTIF